MNQFCRLFLFVAVVASGTFFSGSPLVVCAKHLKQNYESSIPDIEDNTISDVPLSHQVQKRSTHHGSSIQDNFIDTSSGLEDAEDILRMAALVPAETLQLIRMITVPILNTSLGVPAHLLKKLSNASFSDFHAATNWTAPSWLRHDGNSSTHDPLFNLFNLTQTPKSTHDVFHPIQSLFGSGGVSADAVLPQALNADHLKRHLENFKKFLGARENLTMTTTTTTTTTSPEPATKPEATKVILVKH